MKLRTVQRLIRQNLRRHGVEVSRYTWPRLVEAVRPDVVFDIGANIGQYVEELRSAGYRGRIVSFEPLAAAHAELVRRSTADDRWTIAARMALGDAHGDANINIAGNSYSSSLLGMLDLHRQAAPEAGYVGTEAVPVRTLDSVAGDYLRAGERLMIKIDVQGYEQKVLAGASECLRKACALQFEASLVPLYEGEAMLGTLLERVAAEGFELWSLIPGFTDLRSGRLLQVDCFFVRK
jgi:FkbM family methyltransferase